MEIWRRIVGKIGHWKLLSWLRQRLYPADRPSWSYDFARVLADELDAIGVVPTDGASESTSAGTAQLDEVVQRAHTSQLTGLAFSGGGIRSATFNLGILQGLADMQLLQKFHYLSTVSGGGYIGSWLTAWLYRRGFDDVASRLRPSQRQQPDGTEPHEIRFLRQYSNYLTPMLGWFGADTWTLIAIYLRNLLLNLVLLVAMFVAALLLPRGFVWLASIVSQGTAGWWWVLMLLLLLCSGTYIVRNLSLFTRAPSTGTPETDSPQGTAQSSPYYTRQCCIQLLIVLPLFAAAFVATALVDPGNTRQATSPSLWLWGLLAGGGFVAIDVLSTLLLGFWRGFRRSPRPVPAAEPEKTARPWWTVLWSFLAGALGGVLLCGLAQFVSRLPLGAAVVWGPPLGIGVIMLVLVVFIGLMGDVYSDAIHEWWSRLGAWLLIYALVWIGVFGVALYSPPVLKWLALVAQVALGVGWFLSTVGGILAAQSAESSQRHPRPWVAWLATVAPYIFVLGLVAGLAWGVDAVLPVSAATGASGSSSVAATPQRSLTIRVDLPEDETAAQTQNLPVSVQLTPANAQRQTASLPAMLSTHWRRLDAQNQNPAPLLLFLGAVLVMGLFSWRLDINRFSMHQFYRNRLARCYLGASNNTSRRPQPFTGFDPHDDITLGDIGQASHRGKPYPIINAALNLVAGTELAWQQRKAASFVFTPRYCGYDVPEMPPGFCQTTDYAHRPLPVTLAMAMAISGAAASPNMGYHSSAAPTFLMTVFNVRLGWWLGNPRHPTGWRFSSPKHVLWYLIKEMFGLTSAEDKFIYLSDGGHFENLGIYELVRRRCRFIVACDAEQDQNFGFAGLGNAIEKCRADFGVDIEIDVEPIRHRNASGHSQWHCAIGKIHYDKSDTAASQGTLVYLKASLTGDEPTDVLRYAAQHAEFPHQSTADQWFDESQFESYRALGYHVVTEVFGAVDALEKLHGRSREQLFVELRQRWFPPTQARGNFGKHTTTLAALYDTLRTTPDLRFLSSQIYPEWPVLLRNLQPIPQADQLPSTIGEIRQGFYFCNALIQLMEDVYLDLLLEQEYGHPDNRGWMNLFRHWSWAPTFRVTWIISAATYGARFQSFCERHLGLHLGEVRIQEPALRIADLDPDTGSVPDGVFNDVERGLLHSFFRQYGELRATADIFPLQITSPEQISNVGGRLTFTFGFVVLHAHRIVYFRVQNHLRNMGLGRRALVQLLKQKSRPEHPIDIDLKEIPPHPDETLSARDRDAFYQMFRAVQLEFALQKQNASAV